MERNPLWLEWAIPAFLGVVLFGQLVLEARQLSQTADEATHLYSGYRYLKCGDLTFSAEHPPLAKIIAAAPLLFANEPVDCRPFHGDDVTQALTGLSWFYSLPDWSSQLFRCRIAVSGFTVGLAILVWIVTRRMFGFSSALVAMLLLIFEPNIVGNGSLIMTDIVVTATLLLAVYSFYLWTLQRTTGRLLLAGISAGLVLLSKYSGVVVVPILLVFAVVDPFLTRDDKQQFWKQLLRNLLAIATICVLAFVAIWIGYGMRYAAHGGPLLAAEPASALPNTSWAGRILLAFEQRHLLPQAYLEGFACDPHSLLRVVPTDEATRKWLDAPLNLLRVVLIRSTAAWIAIAVLALAGVVTAFKIRPRETIFLAVPAGIFVAGYMHASWNGGIRHLLPAFPFLLILISFACMQVVQRFGRVKYAIAGLLVLHAGSSLYAAPDYLSYANEFVGGPKQAYRHIGGTDIGQSYLQVRDYVERHPSDECTILTAWQWNPELYGLRCKAYGIFLPRLIPPQLHGTVIVSSALLTHTFDEQDVGGQTFRNQPPSDYIGGSAMLVFRGDFDTRPAASMIAERRAIVALGQQQYSDALSLSEYAIQIYPNNCFAHLRRGVVLLAVGDRFGALGEFEIGRALAVAGQGRDEIKQIDGVLEQLRTELGIPNQVVQAN